MRKLYGVEYLKMGELVENQIYHPIRLEYYQLSKQDTCIPMYGIEIVKTQYDRKEIKMENFVLEAVTSKEEIIQEILKRFQKGTVTPISAKEQLEDVLTVLELENFEPQDDQIRWVN